MKPQVRFRFKRIARFPPPHGGRGTGPCLIKGDGVYAPTASHKPINHQQTCARDTLKNKGNKGNNEYRYSISAKKEKCVWL